MRKARILGRCCLDGVATRDWQGNGGDPTCDALAVSPTTRCCPEAPAVDGAMEQPYQLCLSLLTKSVKRHAFKEYTRLDCKYPSIITSTKVPHKFAFDSRSTSFTHSGAGDSIHTTTYSPIFWR